MIFGMKCYKSFSFSSGFLYTSESKNVHEKTTAWGENRENTIKNGSIKASVVC